MSLPSSQLLEDSTDQLTLLANSLISASPDDFEAAKEAVKIVTCRITSPLGELIAGASARGICLLEFYDRESLASQFAVLSKRFNAVIEQGEHPLFVQLQQQIDAYFNGKLKVFDLPLDAPGSEFQRQVWQQLLAIPYGETFSYQQQADAIGRPKAVRAVANSNAANRIAIIIPCHRVIGKNGKLTGYAGGLWRKQKLLYLEQKQQDWLQD